MCLRVTRKCFLAQGMVSAWDGYCHQLSRGKRGLWCRTCRLSYKPDTCFLDQLPGKTRFSVFFFFSDEEGSLYYFTFPGEITTGRVSVNSILQQCIKQENVLMSEDFWMKRGGLFFFFFPQKSKEIFPLRKCTRDAVETSEEKKYF